MIDCQIQRDNLVLTTLNSGKESQLIQSEPYFVDMIIKLSKCYHSIIAFEELYLINSLIQ